MQRFLQLNVQFYVESYVEELRSEQLITKKFGFFKGKHEGILTNELKKVCWIWNFYLT